MNAGRAALFSPPSPTPPPRVGSPLQVAHVSLAAALMAILLIYLPTTSAMVAVWLRSPTFNHGVLIVPIACWLIWRRRAQLAIIPRRPWLTGLCLLAALGAAWLIAAVSNVRVVQQYCLVLMCIVTVATTQGPALTRAIAFPLAYTLLAVPFGEVFIPPLIEFTARFTVVSLQLMGIPVFNDNNFISLPSGNWAVADACSGLRYLIASLALGMLYAVINYQRTGKRLLFIMVALVLPVIANGLRACMVVLIGHWSDMKLAAGVDHLVYGWVFFGLVMAALFWCGAYWRDPPLAIAPPPAALPVPPPPARFIRAGVAVTALCALWPLLASLVLRAAPPDPAPAPALLLTPPPAPWRASPIREGEWQILHRGQPQRLSANYSDGRRAVSLQLTWYRHQSEGDEMLAPVRRTVVSGAPQWEEVAIARRTVHIGTRQWTVRQSVQQAAHYKMLVWRWYRQAGVETASPYLVKLLLARSKLLGGSDAGAEIVVAAPYDEQTAPAETAMQDLLAAMLPAIDQGLRHVER